MGHKVYVDFLGKGFDMGFITKGKENHELWSIDWEDVLFVTPNNMNKYRQYIISNNDYLQSARRRLQHLLKIGYSAEYIKGKIPKTYSPMPPSIKEMLLDEIVFPMYSKESALKRDGLTSFGVQGMVIDGKLFPIEMNRRERFTEKSFLDKDNGTER